MGTTAGTAKRAQELDQALDGFMMQHDEAFGLLAASLDELTDQGATRAQAIAALVRWVRATADEYQG